MKPIKFTSKFGISLLVTLALALLAVSLPVKAQTVPALGPVTLLSASTATNSAAIDVSRMYYHTIVYTSSTTNGAGDELVHVQTTMDNGTTTNWAMVNTNTVSTNAVKLFTFTGAYYRIKLVVTNTTALKNVGTNTAKYFGKPL